jgi:hypothetical protein
MNAMQAAMSKAGFKVTVQPQGTSIGDGNYVLGTNGKMLTNKPDCSLHHGVSSGSLDMDWRARNNSKPLTVTRSKYRSVH